MLIATTAFMPPFDCYAALRAFNSKYIAEHENKIQRTFELDENKRGKSKSIRTPKFSWFRHSYYVFISFFDIYFFRRMRDETILNRATKKKKKIFDYRQLFGSNELSTDYV